MALDRTLFSVTIKESDQNREYWVSRPWLDERKDVVREADILVVPWEDFREGRPTLFPNGTADFAASLSALSDLSVAIAVDRGAYQEILLHSKERRIPTMVVTAIALPAIAGMLGNLLTEAVKGTLEEEAIELKMIVEGEQGRCVSVEYKGPADRLADTVIGEASRCLPPRQRAPERGGHAVAD